jgi:hypothetical protein
MKKSIISTLFLALLIAVNYNAHAQLGGFMKKVKSKIVDKTLGNSDTTTTAKPTSVKNDPLCACSDATIAFKFTGDLRINYKEATFSVSDDGTLLVFDKVSKKYYTAKNSLLQGPFEVNDPIVRRFDIQEEEKGKQLTIESLLALYKGFIIPSGEKYAIKMEGKSYGPFAVIQSFELNHSKNKFAALVTEDVLMTTEQAEKMEAESKNAKTDQEKMALAMKMSQQMQQKMMAAGGTFNGLPQLVSNVPGAKSDMMVGSNLSGKVKYDEIVNVGFDKITDLTGKTLITFDPQKFNTASGGLWLSSDNSRVACYNSGLLTLSNGKTFAEVFCPYLLKSEGKVYLVYMYFSPVNNAIMQCRFPF